MTTEEPVKFKHTPGPWEAVDDWDDECISVRCEAGTICEITYYKPRAHENAKLISIATELYDLAQAVLTLEKGEYSKEIVFEMARVILNKLK
jgi:hypothetical protein